MAYRRYWIVFFFSTFALSSDLTETPGSRHSLSQAQARQSSLAYIVCYNVDSCITVVSGSLLAFWIIACGIWGTKVIDDVLLTGFGDACKLN